MADPMDVALVTEAELEHPTELGWYERNVLEEDRILSAALSEVGLTGQRVDWAREDVDWSRFSGALLRTPWNYFVHFEAFMAWVARVSSQTRLLNAPETIRWNVDKRYLLELLAAGVATVPTEILERGDPRTLAEVMAARGFGEAVLKPVVSGAGRHTHRVKPDDTGEAILRERVAAEAMMLQPFVPDVVARGEVTVVVIDGTPTHALLKRPAPGEFRVQDDHGGTVHDHEATAEELELAARAIACSPTPPLYGRVDIVRDERGTPMVMELELVEPELWFRRNPSAATRLAGAVARALAAGEKNPPPK